MCSFTWADKYWILSQLRKPGPDDERIGGGSEKMGSGTGIGKSVVTMDLCERTEELRPPDLTIPLRPEGTTMRMFWNTAVAEEWINGYFAVGQQVR